MFGEKQERLPAQAAVCVVSVSKSDQLFIVEQIPNEKLGKRACGPQFPLSQQ